jgi:ribonuclease Z
MNRVLILGSSNAIPKLDQENTHLYIEAGEKKILVDCGDNPLVGMKRSGIDPNSITDLILTHFHPDHVGSLPNFLMGMWLEKRVQPLIVHVLEYTLDRAKALLGLFGWSEWRNMYPVSFNTVSEAQLSTIIKSKEIAVQAIPVVHLIPNIGLRFDFSNNYSVVYTSDTEPCENVILLSKNADILIHEAAGPGKGHTSSEQAGKIAATAKVKKLFLIHYDQQSGVDALVNAAKQEFVGDVVAATDGLDLL